jgi:hypothetical protein
MARLRSVRKHAKPGRDSDSLWRQDSRALCHAAVQQSCQRRGLGRKANASSAFAGVSSTGRVLAEENDGPNNPFILLLKGLYQPVPVGHGPANNLGLFSVNLSDGSYSRTQIYPVFGIRSEDGRGDENKAIGTFYVQFTGNLCAYDLTGCALAMSFNSIPRGAPPGFNGFVPFPDGKGGNYLEGTFELAILEATGIYQAFQGGHNHMVDRLHQLPNNGGFNEFCFCNISQYQFP